MTLGAELFAAPLCSLFVGYDAALLEKPFRASTNLPCLSF